MVDNRSDLDLIPAIAPAKDEVASYRRSGRSDAPKQSNFNGILVFALVLMAIVMVSLTLTITVQLKQVQVQTEDVLSTMPTMTVLKTRMINVLMLLEPFLTTDVQKLLSKSSTN